MSNYSKTNDVLGSVNRGDPCESGLCTLCRADCKGKCETWLASMKGRKMLYPRDFGAVTAGSSNVNHVGCLLQQSAHSGVYNYGAHGIPVGLSNSADDCIFPNVSLETTFGKAVKTKSRLPLMNGRAGVHLYCRQILGILRCRRVAGGIADCDRRERSRRGPGSGDGERQDYQRTRAGAQNRYLPAVL